MKTELRNNLNTVLSILGCVKNILLHKPILAIYDTTKLCNQNCPMCNIRKDKSDKMSLQEIEQTASALEKFGVKGVAGTIYNIVMTFINFVYFIINFFK